MGDHALITAAVAPLAISIATMPEGRFAARLPTNAAKAQALVAPTTHARTACRGAEAKAVLVLVRAYQRAPAALPPTLSGWLDRPQGPGVVHLREGVRRLAPRPRPRTAIRRNKTLVERLARMHVTVAQAAGAVVRGAADAC